ncbi:hypothetical protein BDN72DRAFT_841168 [Pluteus cervinus]|uniref:Uncharacterized protein n=1 Tax=Pluteus cervinus TaxID=181527 RepID=A0ACD3ATE4_9AGAR|nr:hypothetical protein BDN72DRAFT_841168 [Pluteus cervinus]
MEVRDETLTLVESKEDPSSFSGSSSASLLSSSRPQLLTVTRDHKRMGWHLLLTTLTIVTLSAGLGILLLLWVFCLHEVKEADGMSAIESVRRTGAFFVNEGTVVDGGGVERARLRVLTFSSVTTQIVAATVPVLVMMTAYCTAGAWLAQQERPSEEGENLPTPAQLGLLVKLSSTAGVVAMYETVQYLFIRRLRKGRESAPSLFHVAFLTVVVIYLVTHLISAADLWLHVTSYAVVWDTTIVPIDAFSLVSNANSSFSYPYYPLGIKFNDTLCTNSSASAPCLMDDVFWASSAPSVAASGYLMAANSTFFGLFPDDKPNPRYPLSVITLHDQGDLAVIVPTSGSTNDSWTWTGSTYGIKASCNSLTQGCGSSGSDCAEAGYPDMPSSNFTSGKTSAEITFELNGTVSSDIQGYYRNHSALLDNPHEIQVSLSWEDLVSGFQASFTNGPYSTNQVTSQAQSADHFILPTRSLDDPAGFLMNGTDNRTLAFAACQMEYFNLTIKHDIGGTYSVVNGTMEPSSKSFAAIMSGPLLMGMANERLQANLQARVVAIHNGTGTLAALNQELGRLSLALFAGSVITQPPVSLHVTNSSLISRYGALPVLTYASLLFLYSTIVLAIFVWASTIKSPVVKAGDGKTTTSLKLAQSLLTDPLVLVGRAIPQSLHGVQADVGSGLDAPIDMFGEVAEKGGDLVGNEKASVRRRAPRLALGVVEDGPKAGMIFGVHEWKPTSM